MKGASELSARCPTFQDRSAFARSYLQSGHDLHSAQQLLQRSKTRAEQAALFR